MGMGTRITGPGNVRRNSRWLVGGAIGLIALVAAACGSSGAATTAAKAPSVAKAKSSTPVTVTTAKTPKLGTILVDQAGVTLYTFTLDSKNMTHLHRCMCDAVAAVDAAERYPPRRRLDRVWLPQSSACSPVREVGCK